MTLIQAQQASDGKLANTLSSLNGSLNKYKGNPYKQELITKWRQQRRIIKAEVERRKEEKSNDI